LASPESIDMSDLPRRRCAYAGNSNTNAQREYTCGAARAPTRKWRLDDWHPGGLWWAARARRMGVERRWKLWAKGPKI